MKNLTHKIIAQELLKLSANYPNPKTNDELQILSEMWLEDLSHISKEIFLKATQAHRRQSRFFPTVADILECYQTVVRNTPKPLALVEPHIEFTQEEETERKQLVADFKAKRKYKSPQDIKALVGKIGAT